MQQITYSEFLSKYKIRQKIGEGGYGQVFRAYDTETKSYMALKKIVLRPNQDLESFYTEIGIQSFLAHPLVLKIFEFYVYEAKDKHLGSKVQFGIITELGQTSLQRLIRDKTNDFPIQEIINFAFHFTKLFAYFQTLKIVHRDIKPQNFVQSGSGLSCKLIDFGLCTPVKDIRHTAGSFPYMSPILKKMHTHKELRGITKSNPYKDDVYSFGLTLYELITRQGPQMRINESSHRFSSNVFHKTQNQKLAQIVQLMLEYEQKIRPDFNELYNIFKQNFEFIEEDPVNQIDGYSDKDLAKMNCHQRYAVIKKRHEYQQLREKTHRKNYEDQTFKKTNKNLDSEQQDESNIQRFESKKVYYIDKEMEEQVNRRKKRHFGNQKVILREQPTSHTYKKETYFKEEPSKYPKPEQSDYQQQREYESVQNFDEFEKTVEIDKSVIDSPHFQNQADYNFNNSNQIGQNIVEIPVLRNDQIQMQQIQPPNQHQPVQEEAKCNKFYWSLPPGISLTAIIMVKGFIICGCSDGNLRVIIPTSAHKKISYKIVGTQNLHEGYKITAIAKDADGMIWTASQNGKVMRWDRNKLFTNLQNESNYFEQNAQIIDDSGSCHFLMVGSVKFDSEVSQLVDTSNKNGYKQGITVLYCLKINKFAVGYNDGSVFAIWGDNRYRYKQQDTAIMSIKSLDEQLYSASLDGRIVILDMKNQQLRNQFFKCPFGIRNFLVSGNSQCPEFFIATVNGRGYKHQISDGNWEVKDDSETDPIDIKDAFFANNQMAFTLSSNGNILKNGQNALGCVYGQDWSCMYWDNDVSIVVGSSQGYVCLIKCE